MSDFRPDFVLRMAGFRIGLAGLRSLADGEAAEVALRERFRLFVEAPAGAATAETAVPPGPAAAPGSLPPRPGGPLDLAVTVRPSAERQFLPYPAEDGHRIYRLESRVKDGRLHAWSYAFSGSLSLREADGELALCEAGFEPAARSIENFLRVALAWKAASRGSVLLHASGVVRNGRAFVFFGPSGSGKTTVTRLSRPALVLNDDVILIARHGDALAASGVPFKGSDDVGAEHSGEFPLAGLFRLVQAGEDRAERLGVARAVGELAASVPFVTDTPDGLERIFDLLQDLARECPVFVLRFRNSDAFWPVAERAAVDAAS